MRWRSALVLLSLAAGATSACGGDDKKYATIPSDPDAVEAEPGVSPLHPVKATTQPVPRDKWGPASCVPTKKPVGTGVGQRVRELKLRDCNGKETTLDAYCGAAATWLFIGHGWCPKCKKTAGYANQIAKDYDAKDLVVVNLLAQDASYEIPTAEFCQLWRDKYGLDAAHVLYDPTGEQAHSFENGGTPIQVFIDVDQVIAFRSNTSTESVIRSQIDATLARIPLHSAAERRGFATPRMDKNAPNPSLKTVVATAKPRSRDRGVLTVTGGDEAGRLISLSDAVVTFGRSDEAIIQFQDVSLSRIHARLMRAAGNWIIADAGSTNGTFVNDQRLTKPVQLADGDRVQLGSSTLLRFSLVDETEEQALRQVYEAAMKDGLTGVSNRKHLEERLDAEVAYALRNNSELSLVMLDVDHFKRVNDTYGHPAGDAVLRFMASVLTRALRTEDLLARYGGEEFCIVVRGVDARTTTAVADRLRLWISQSPIMWESQQIWITSSAGVASLACCGEKRDKATLLSTADQRLYKAKNGGRNRVVGPDQE